MSSLLDQRARTPGSRGVVPGARAARRGDHDTLRRRDLELVGWLGEQYGARVDQVELLLDCGPRTVQRILARAAGHGFGAWHPQIGLLAHVAAVNDVRLHIQARSPESEWVPERLLARERQAGEHLPDGVVLTDGRRVAIEVELTIKSGRRVRAILDELTGRFDAVLYFCAPGPHRQLSQLAESGRWPTLGVRELARPTGAP
jgi:hypothetical protein